MTRTHIRLIAVIVIWFCIAGGAYLATGKMLQTFAQKLQTDMDKIGQIVEIFTKDPSLSPPSYSALQGFQDQGYSAATLFMMSKYPNDARQRDAVFVAGVLKSRNFQTLELLMGHKSLFDEQERQRLVLSTEGADITPRLKQSTLYRAQSTLSPQLQQEMGQCLSKLKRRYTRLFRSNEMTLTPIMVDRLMDNRVCEFSVDA